MRGGSVDSQIEQAVKSRAQKARRIQQIQGATMYKQQLIWCLVIVALQVSTAAAAGPFQRMRTASNRGANVYVAPRQSANFSSASQTYGGNTGASRSRLPAGRSYYQGRYYGHLNNRFYGPQYGYF
jgi:hypothetical protein